EMGGRAVKSRVGHSFIKKLMADEGAFFGGEHSGHFYLSSFWRADSGMLAALYAIAALKESEKSLSEILAPFQRYVQSGEINSVVDDREAAISKIMALFPEGEYKYDHLDGLTIEKPVDEEQHDESVEWWFNLRPSNTEPLLRLNVEARDEATMKKIRDQVLATIRS
ncbi:MAG: phosphomannomutase/phosphoglucomutase, partial [Candidatus Nanopelagicaceae bacterium]